MDDCVTDPSIGWVNDVSEFFTPIRRLITSLSIFRREAKRSALWLRWPPNLKTLADVKLHVLSALNYQIGGLR